MTIKWYRLIGVLMVCLSSGIVSWLIYWAFQPTLTHLGIGACVLLGVAFVMAYVEELRKE